MSERMMLLIEFDPAIAETPVLNNIATTVGEQIPEAGMYLARGDNQLMIDILQVAGILPVGAESMISEAGA